MVRGLAIIHYMLGPRGSAPLEVSSCHHAPSFISAVVKKGNNVGHVRDQWRLEAVLLLQRVRCRMHDPNGTLPSSSEVKPQSACSPCYQSSRDTPPG